MIQERVGVRRAAATLAAVGAVVLAGGIAVGVGGAGAAGCGSSDDTTSVAPQMAQALADGVAGAVTAARALAAPYRCAQPSRTALPTLPPIPARLGQRAHRTLTLAGDTLRLLPRGHEHAHDHTLVLGVVADARGVTPTTLGQLAQIRTAFAQDGVELVVSLGGMGRTKDEISAVLGALAHEGDPWVLWAMPGDRESVAAHRAAVATLLAADRPVFDASRVRMVEADGAVLAAFPGVEQPDELVAGVDGCVHNAADAAALAARLSAAHGVRVWAGYAPPRGQSPSDDDVALGGVHVGEQTLTAALAAARADLVLHGMVDQAVLGPAAGRAGVGGTSAPVVLGAGPVEALPVWGPGGPAADGGALVVRVSEHGVSWRRVRFPLPGRGARPGHHHHHSHR